jgi:hypothetical protein
VAADSRASRRNRFGGEKLELFSISSKPLSAAPQNEVECDAIKRFRLGLFFDLPSGMGLGTRLW